MSLPGSKAAAVAALLLVAGCARHVRVIPPGTEFKIVDVRNHGLILPPPIVNLPTTTPFSFQFPVALGTSNKRPIAKTDCVDTNDLFNIRIDRKTRQLAISLPSLADWKSLLPVWEQPDQTELHQKIAAIVNAPQSLEAQGCLTGPSAVTLRQL